MNNQRAYITLAILIAITLAFSLLGIMFGHHWDEARIMNSARETFQTGNPLPGWYVYPSVPHDLASLVQLTKFFSSIYPGFEEAWKQHLMVRGVFMLYSCAGIVFTFLLARLFTKRNFYSLIAAAFLAFSWEFGYHIRWIAPDSIMMANVIACIYWCCRYYQHPRTKRLVVAGIFGGLATGCKYPAGLVALPLLIATFYRVKQETKGNAKFWNTLIRRWLVIGTITSFTFILTTPGFIFDFNQLWQDLYEHINIYQGTHSNYKFYPLKNPPIDHFLVLIEYFSMAVFSKQALLSLLSSLFVLAGLYHMAKLKKPLLLITFSFPSIYFIFFCFQSYMVPRNYQVLLPFLFLLAAIGIQSIIHRTKFSLLKRVLLGFTFFVLGFNVYFGFKAGLSIYSYSKDQLYPSLEAYIKARPAQTFYLTSKVQADHLDSGANLPPNVIKKDTMPDSGSFKVASYTTKKYAHHWPRYSHNFVDHVIGQQEVNVNYYPTWNGYPKILIVDDARFKAFKKSIPKQ